MKRHYETDISMVYLYPQAEQILKSQKIAEGKFGHLKGVLDTKMIKVWQNLKLNS